MHLRCACVEASVIGQVEILLFGDALLELSKDVVIDVAFVAAPLKEILGIGVSAASVLPRQEIGTNRKQNGVGIGVGMHGRLR